MQFNWALKGIHWYRHMRMHAVACLSITEVHYRSIHFNKIDAIRKSFDFIMGRSSSFASEGKLSPTPAVVVVYKCKVVMMYTCTSCKSR